MAISICFSLLLTFLSQLPSSHAEPFIGVNYGQVADNLPPPSETAKLLQSTSIQKVRLYGADPAIIKALVEATSDKSSGKIQPKSDVELNFCFAPKKTIQCPFNTRPEERSLQVLN
ncbi:hypothetical protein Bca4012_065770 [Brassica carinata]